MKHEVPGYEWARNELLKRVMPMPSEHRPLALCAGRVLAQDLVAKDNVPPFDRSPYDGYALRAMDTAGAEQSPVTLRILEEVPAGHVCHFQVGPGTAVKVLTGSPIPEGADAVVPFEDTDFTPETVTLSKEVRSGSNIVRAGEDIKKGAVLAQRGTRIDAGLLGTLAAQNQDRPLVYKVPRIGILSTGTELCEPGEALGAGKIYNSNRYTLTAALLGLGCEPVYLGTAGDDADRIAELFEEGLSCCDAVVSTGGVSVGDYDLTPQAMEKAGARILFRGVALKPGMACCYAERDGKLLMGLSGNPASSMTTFHAVSAPALRQLCGYRALPQEITVTLAEAFKKRSPMTRLLRGRLDLTQGKARMHLCGDQGNVVLSSLIGSDVMAVVPAGSGPLEAGTELKGFLI